MSGRPADWQFQSVRLESLARLRFVALNRSEILVLRAATAGEIANCSVHAPATNSNRSGSTKTPAGKSHLRAELIRWLCTNRDAKAEVVSIRISSAVIDEQLDLSFIDIPFAFNVEDSKLRRLVLNSGHCSALNLKGSQLGSLQAFGARTNSISLEACTIRGEVGLLGARINGELNCRSAQFLNAPDPAVRTSGIALHADEIVVDGSIYLERDFRSEGQVRLISAQIGGNLQCSTAWFYNPPKPKGLSGNEFPNAGVALYGDGLTVRGDAVFRSGFRAQGQVRLPAAHIGRHLDFSGAQLSNSPERGFSLRCDSDGSNQEGLALFADNVDVQGHALLRDGFIAHGCVVLSDAQVGGVLELKGSSFKRARLNLRNAKAGAFSDGEANLTSNPTYDASWPGPNNLDLDGFVYGRITGGTRDDEKRKKWLALDGSFSTQPYRQLARILSESGDSDGANAVLIEMERRRNAALGGVVSNVENVFKASIGYGHHPLNALGYLSALSVLGWVIYRRSDRAGNVMPTKEGVKRTSLPDHYPRFSPFIYSIENSFPLIKLGQAEHWHPTPKGPVKHASWGDLCRSWRQRAIWCIRHPCAATTGKGFTRKFLLLQIVLGWLLATLFVAGITGLIHND